jgi:hypothetical protein
VVGDESERLYTSETNAEWCDDTDEKREEAQVKEGEMGKAEAQRTEVVVTPRR